MYQEFHKQILNHSTLITTTQKCHKITIFDLGLDHFLIMNDQIFNSHAQKQESHMFSKWNLLTQVI
jgi:hypothetical protein